MKLPFSERLGARSRRDPSDVGAASERTPQDRPGCPGAAVGRGGFCVKMRVTEFVRDEDGAVTIEWVALAAGATTLALGIMVVLAPSLQASAGSIATVLAAIGTEPEAPAAAPSLTCTGGFCRDGGGTVVGFTDGNNFAPSDGNGSFHNPVPIADSGFSLSGTTPSGAAL